MAQGLEAPTKKKKTSPSWTSQHFLALILSYLIYLILCITLQSLQRDDFWDLIVVETNYTMFAKNFQIHPSASLPPLLKWTIYRENLKK